MKSTQTQVNTTAKNNNIYERDAAILEKLGLKIGQILNWEDIESHIRKYIVPSDIQTVCETCSWRSYGVCEEGIQEILEGKGLREVQISPSPLFIDIINTIKTEFIIQ